MAWRPLDLIAYYYRLQAIIHSDYWLLYTHHTNVGCINRAHALPRTQTYIHQYDRISCHIENKKHTEVFTDQNSTCPLARDYHIWCPTELWNSQDDDDAPSRFNKNSNELYNLENWLSCQLLCGSNILILSVSKPNLLVDFKSCPSPVCHVLYLYLSIILWHQLCHSVIIQHSITQSSAHKLFGYLWRTFNQTINLMLAIYEQHSINQFEPILIWTKLNQSMNSINDWQLCMDNLHKEHCKHVKQQYTALLKILHLYFWWPSLAYSQCAQRWPKTVLISFVFQNEAQIAFPQSIYSSYYPA
jgi:hypothetical protein